MIKNWSIDIKRKKGDPVGFLFEGSQKEADDLLAILRELLEGGDIKDFDITPLRAFYHAAARRFILGVGRP